MVSGGFDPPHNGHTRLIRGAAEHGRVVVALNSDEWLIRKKGFRYLSWGDRAEVLMAIRGVCDVVSVDDSDGTVCDAIERYRPDYFANGGDRMDKNTPEVELCKSLGVGLLWGVGGGKINSSSEIMGRGVVERKWGTYKILSEFAGCKIKLIVVKPGCSTSRQRHQHRNEHWIYPNDEHQFIPAGAWHQLVNPSGSPLQVIEIQTGSAFDEDDIERA